MGTASAWVLMELPAVATMAICFLVGSRHGVTETVWLALWEAHYLHRALVYPLRHRGSGGRTPVVIVLLGAIFNLVNGYFNGRWLFGLGPERGADWLVDPRFLVGVLLFVGGMAIHLDADARLRRLRRSKGAGYGVPEGGLFRLVSCPNYLGEIVEWCGWALLTWSLPGLAFAWWTVANLGPRAAFHHRWYLERFPDYPSKRRALVPFLF